MATGREPLLLPPRTPSRVATAVIRLRLGHLCATQIYRRAPEPCPHCLVEEEDPLLHYLLRCPATQDLRPRYLLLQEDEAAQAAQIVAAAPVPSLITMCLRYPPPRWPVHLLQQRINTDVAPSLLLYKNFLINDSMLGLDDTHDYVTEFTMWRSRWSAVEKSSWPTTILDTYEQCSPNYPVIKKIVTNVCHFACFICHSWAKFFNS